MTPAAWQATYATYTTAGVGTSVDSSHANSTTLAQSARGLIQLHNAGYGRHPASQRGGNQEKNVSLYKVKSTCPQSRDLDAVA